MVIPMGRVADHSVAAGWGFAEATFFFVVPDVWTSWVGLRRPRRALTCCLSALGGAMAGGTVTYLWSRRMPERTTRRWMAKVPAVSEQMVVEVEAELQHEGHRSLMRGPTRGVPYKLYARASGLQGRSLVSFLAWSVPARLLRFAAVTLLASGAAAAAHRAAPRLPEPAVSMVFAGCWSAFYLWFFRTFSRR